MKVLKNMNMVVQLQRCLYKLENHHLKKEQEGREMSHVGCVIMKVVKVCLKKRYHKKIIFVYTIEDLISLDEAVK